MLKTFLGIDLKTGAKIILFIHLVENFVIFLVISIASTLKSKQHNQNDNNDFIEIPLVNVKYGERYRD